MRFRRLASADSNRTLTGWLRGSARCLSSGFPFGGRFAPWTLNDPTFLPSLPNPFARRRLKTSADWAESGTSPFMAIFPWPLAAGRWEAQDVHRPDSLRGSLCSSDFARNSLALPSPPEPFARRRLMASADWAENGASPLGLCLEFHGLSARSRGSDL